MADLTLDGNAIAGVLAEVFAYEMTTARGACSVCGTVAELAGAVVYVHAPGVVCRCRRCDNVLAVFVRRDERYRASLQGLRWVEPAAD